MPTKTTKSKDEEAPKKKTAAKKPAAPKAKAAPKKKKDEAVVEMPAKELAAMEKMEAAEEVASKAAKGGSFIPAVGRRKTSIARVRLIKNGKGMITVNGKVYDSYFTTYEMRETVASPLKVTGQDSAVDVSAKVQGGGVRGQAEAVRHGISRALEVLNPTFRKTLKKLGYLTRDPRKKERKKFGLKGARRSPQWSKR